MYLYSEPISDNWRTSMENYELVKYLIIDFLSSPQFSSSKTHQWHFVVNPTCVI